MLPGGGFFLLISTPNILARMNMSRNFGMMLHVSRKPRPDTTSRASMEIHILEEDSETDRENLKKR